MKPEYRILFEFIHSVFLSYAGYNENVSLPKLRIMSAVLKQLDVNWARLLVNLLIVEATRITQVLDGDRVVEIKVKYPLHHRTKISFLLHSSLPDHDWPDKEEISKVQLIPNSKLHLEMQLV